MNHVNFTHDFNPGQGPVVSPIDSGNGFGTTVFWTAVIPNSDVQVNPITGTAHMHISNLPELDYYSPAGFGDLASLGPTWQTGYFGSTVSMDVVWTGPVTRRVHVSDAANGFAGTFNENQATVTWSARSDSGFRFTSNPGNFSTSVPETPGVNGVTAPLNFFAMVGLERNGIFFHQGDMGDRDDSHGGLALPSMSSALALVGPVLHPASADLALRGTGDALRLDASGSGNGGWQPLHSVGLNPASAGNHTAETAAALLAARDRAFALGLDAMAADIFSDPGLHGTGALFR